MLNASQNKKGPPVSGGRPFFLVGLPAIVRFRLAEQYFIRRNTLLVFFDCVGSVFGVFHLSFQVIYFFEIGFYFLEHIKGFAASGTRRTDEDNRLVSRQTINLFFEFTDRNINCGLEMAGGKFIRVSHIDQIYTLGIFFQDFTKGVKIN